MTFEQIKNEISARLREVRAEADDFRDAEMYPDLKKLIAKAISRVALCDTAADLDRLNDLLEAIEDTYNSCKTEVTGEDSDDSLFDFDFELESEDNGNEQTETEAPEEYPAPEAETEEEDEEEPDAPEEAPQYFENRDREVAACIAEIEEFYKAHYSKGGVTEKNRLKAIRARALDRVEAANTPFELTDAVIEYRKNFGKYEKCLDSYDRRESAKPSFDRGHELNKKLNFARLFGGILVTVAGLVAWLVTKEWIGFPLAALIFGGAYLILSGVYAIVISKSLDTAAYRNMAFARLIIAAAAIVGSLILGIALPSSEGFGLGYAFAATVPLTLGGLAVYIVCRLQLSIFVAKSKKAKKKK